MSDYIYVKHGITYILIWESSIAEEDVPDHRFTKWYESNYPFFTLGLVAFAMFLYLLSNVRLSMLAEKCDSCEKFSDDQMYSTNLMVCSGSFYHLDFYSVPHLSLLIDMYI